MQDNLSDLKFSKLIHALKAIEKRRIENFSSLTRAARQTAEDMLLTLKKIGVKIEKYFTLEDSGSPLLMLDDNKPFKEKIHSLDKALQDVFNMHTISSGMPLGHPAEKKHITSFLGNALILLRNSLQYTQK